MDNLVNAINKAIQQNSNAPASFGITKTPEIQSRTVKEQTFLEYLELKNRTRDINTNNVSFYKENGGTDASFIQEVADIPEYTATTFTEVTDSTKTIAIPINISMKAQEGTDVIDLKQYLINDGYVKVNNLIDEALQKAPASPDANRFNPITTEVATVSAADNPITEALIKDTIQACVDAGGHPDCLVTTPTVANQIDELVSPYLRYNNVTEIALGHTVSTFKSTDGSFIPILVDNNVPAGTINVLDTSTIDVAYQRRPSFISLAQTKLATNDAIYAWVTAFNTGTFKSRVITNIGNGE